VQFGTTPAIKQRSASTDQAEVSHREDYDGIGFLQKAITPARFRD
jgi:hypothetical protein